MTPARKPATEAVTGTEVEPEQTTVTPGASQVKATSERAVGRTWQQTTIPGAVIVLLSWGAALAHLDLDPTGPGRDLPATVATALVVLLTGWMGYNMNKAGLRATDDE